MKPNIAGKAAWRAIVAASVAAIVALAAPAFAQTTTTGRVVGTIVDAQGGALPGVAVTAQSPQLQGTRTAITDSTGTFRFPTLPPGVYTIKAELTGFKPIDQENVTVSLDRSVSLNLKMQVAGVTAEVTVLGSSPVVDTTSAAGGVTIDEKTMMLLPVQRNLYATARFAPGVTSDSVGPTMLGSSGAENKYIIEGIDSTGIDTGSQRKTVLVDFIQEVNVKTEGANAEYGRFTGGMLEAITKSGSNTFHGSLYGFGQGGGLIAANATAPLRPITTTTVSSIGHQYDAGGTLGGFLVKDKLWFFGGYNPFNEQADYTVIRPLGTIPGTPGVGSVVPLKTTRNLYSGKLTYNAAPSQTIVFVINGDPGKQEGNIFNIAGPPSTWQGTINSGSADFMGRYDGVIGSSWLFRAQAGRHHELQTYTGDGSSTPLLIDQTVNPNLRSGGFGYFENHDFKRDEYKADVTRYLSGHTLKGGYDYVHVDSSIERESGGGGQSINRLIQPSTGTIYYRHRYYVNDQLPGFSRTNPSTWQIALPLTSDPVNKGMAAYAQDSWRVKPNLTIEGGFRWERQNLGDRFGQSVVDLKKNWAGRIGFTFDPMNDGKSKFFAHYGTYYEDIPSDINIRAFGGELTCFCYNFSPDPANLAPISGTPGRSQLLGGSTEPVDPNLQGQHVNEFLVGFEREILPDLTVGIRYNHRKLVDVIEDFLCPGGACLKVPGQPGGIVDNVGDYFIANPGQGTLGRNLGFYDGASAPAPLAQRTNDAVEVIATKRFSKNYQFLASYVWSKLEGNYDGTFQNSTGQLDPNINSAFDYGDFLINAQGRLTNERVHQLKFDGAYQVASGPIKDLQLGVSTRWYSGLPLTAYGYSFAYASWEYYLTPRGSLGRGPGEYETDVHIGYPIKIGPTASATIIGDVFNLFNRQAITTLDQRYNLVSGGACSGIPAALCNGDGGLQHNGATINPIAQLSNPTATATNADFLKAGTGFTGQRSLRVGVRIQF
jgi:hypothetical protein